MSDRDEFQLLDCTLRDGGYYNNWDFHKGLVSRYLNAVRQSGLELVEIGFRNLASEGFAGAYYYTSDDFLRTLDVPEGLRLGVMINAVTVLKAGGDIGGTMSRLFAPAADSPVEFVRVAVSYAHYKAAQPILDWLRQAGYITGLNLMQADGKTTEDMSAVAGDIAAWGSVDVLYFADSLGNMEPDDVTQIVAALRSSWSGKLGIHTHNNTGRALANSLRAIDAGVDWIDVTVAGMGRGAGNTPTEYLLSHLSRRTDRFEALPVSLLATEDFAELKAEHGWGENLFYHIGAQANVHPTFVQEMLQDSRYDAQDILGTLEYLANSETRSFDTAMLMQASYGGEDYKKGAWSAQDYCKGRDVLIIGAGPSLKRHQDALMTYIAQNQPMVFSINLQDSLPADHVDAYILTSQMRALTARDRYTNIKGTIIAPAPIVQLLSPALPKCDMHSYGISVQPGYFEIAMNYCVLPTLNSLGYAMAVATAGGAGHIFLAGFDGYTNDDRRQQDVISQLEAYAQLDGVPVTSLLPTTYPVERGSLYAPKS